MPEVNEHPSVEQTSDPVLGAVCSTLGGILSGGIDVHRCNAAKALGRIGGDASVQPLVAALLDEDEDVRTDAAHALLELADPRAGQQLYENLLGDPCTEVKLAAIGTLAKLQDKRVIPLLRRLVRERDSEIVWDEREFFESGWDDWVEVQMIAISALAEMGAAEAVPDIVAAIRDEEAQDITETAFKALVRMGATGIGALADFLNEKTTRPRRRAAAVLAASELEEVQEYLPLVFSDDSPEVRMAALRARAGAFPADVWLVAMLNDPSADIRAETVGLATGLLFSELWALIDDPSPNVQAAVIQAVSKSEDMPTSKEILGKLGEKLHSRSAQVSGAAGYALAILAPEFAMKELISTLGNKDLPVKTRLGALNALKEISDDEVVAAIVPLIADEQRQVRFAAIAALADLATADAIWPNLAGDTLLATLSDADDSEADDEAPVETAEPADEAEEETSEDEMENASETTGPAEADPLSDDSFPTSTIASILEDPSEFSPDTNKFGEEIELTSEDMERLAIARNVKGKKKVSSEPEVPADIDARRFAAKVLGLLDHQDVALALVAGLGSDDPEIEMAAANSLASIALRNKQLPDAVTAALADRLDGATRDMKLPLLRALAMCADENVIDRLSENLDDEDSFVRAETIRTISRISNGGIDFEPYLTDPDSTVRFCAASAIADVGGPRAIEDLVEFALSFEGYHGRETARLLRTLDADRASAGFLDILGDPDQRRVWAVAIEALEELNQKQTTTPLS